MVCTERNSWGPFLNIATIKGLKETIQIKVYSIIWHINDTQKLLFIIVAVVTMILSQHSISSLRIVGGRKGW